MEHIYIVDTALAEVPINYGAIVDATTLARKVDLAYNASGLVLTWNFITPGGAYTATAVTPTNTGGNYDWVTGETVTIEIPASGGASINNDTEGTGWFTGFATGFLPWKSPVFRFLPAAAANALGLGTNFVTTADLDTAADIIAAMDADPPGVTISSAAISDIAAGVSTTGFGATITAKLLALT
jgi:hypothetical protein